MHQSQKIENNSELHMILFQYSEEPPVVSKAKKACNLENCFDEVNLYIKNATEKFGKFEFAPARMQLDPKLEEEQIKILYPKVQAVNIPNIS